MRIPDAEVIGRYDELATLRRAAQATSRGLRVVIVRGGFGLGKAQLVENFCDQAEADGHLTVSSECIDYADRAVPFDPFTRIVRALTNRPTDAVRSVIDSRNDLLTRLVPELGTSSDHPTDLRNVGVHVHDAIAALLGAVAAGKPVVIAIEDVQWADPSTRDAISYLTRALEASPVMLVLTARLDNVDRGDPVRTWLSELDRRPTTESFDLRPLDLDDVGRLAGALDIELGDAAIERVWRRSAGVPLFARILLEHGEIDGAIPDAIVGMLHADLGPIDDDMAAVLDALAVVDAPCTHERLIGITELDDARVRAALRHLSGRLAVTSSADGYRIRIGLLREALIDELLPFDAEDLHRRAAETMQTARVSQPSAADLAALAGHWHAANRPVETIGTAIRAGDACRAAGDLAVAAEMYDLALQNWMRADDPESVAALARHELLLRSVEAKDGASLLTVASDQIEQAIAEWTDLGIDGRAMLRARQAILMLHIGHPVVGHEAMDEAELFAIGRAAGTVAYVTNRAARFALINNDLQTATAKAEEALLITEGMDDTRNRLDALVMMATCVALAGDEPEAHRRASEARDIAMSLDFPAQVATTYRVELLAMVRASGPTNEAVELLEHALVYVREHCGPSLIAEFLLDLCVTTAEIGRLRHCSSCIVELLDMPLEGGFALTFLQVRAAHALAVGDLTAARMLLDEARPEADLYESPQHAGYQARLDAELARRSGQLDDALANTRRSLATLFESDANDFIRDAVVEGLRVIGANIDDARRRGASRRIPPLVSEAHAIVDRYAAVTPADAAYHMLMDAELDRIQLISRPARFASAAGELAAVGFGYEAAQARLAQLEAIVDDPSRREDAVSLASQIHAAASAGGMSWIRIEIEALARRSRFDIPEPDSNVVPSRSTRAQAYGLTERELDVLELVADGLTNKQIAERLVISARTVATHVSNILAKLEVTNRAEAGARYHRELRLTIDLRDPSNERSFTD